MGAMYLMHQAVDILIAKGNNITKEEAEGVCLAILMHDIGHGPYSHTLEHSIVSGISHEKISELLMERLNDEFNGKLGLAMEIFNNKYRKKFLNQLISSQLDMDRLDYLKRDSFFTGVSEGVINAERIIKMLEIINDEIVVEAKGIYSIEKFIIARRLMYWQVYLHKTVLGAEYLLRKILTRAKDLSKRGVSLFASPAFITFLKHDYNLNDFKNNPELLDKFSKLDDYDIFNSIKVWTEHDDKVLSFLSRSLVNRRLFKVILQNKPFDKEFIGQIKQETIKKYGIDNDTADYFVYTDSTSSFAFDPVEGTINILYKDGSIDDIRKASDQLNISVLTNPLTKHFLCCPKSVYNAISK